VTEAELAVARLAAVGARHPDRGRASQCPVGANPGQHLYRQIGQQPPQAGLVVAGVGHDQDLRVAHRPLSGGDQPLDQLP
jgi:hypothetical protein